MSYGWNERKSAMNDMFERSGKFDTSRQHVDADDMSQFCSGCNAACCRSDLIILHPEHGDDVDVYDTVEVTNPITGEKVRALRRKPDGTCVYLQDGRCVIHGRHPVICRTFDCGRMFDAWDAKKRMNFVRAGWMSRDVIRAGRKVSSARKVRKATRMEV